MGRLMFALFLALMISFAFTADDDEFEDKSFDDKSFDDRAYGAMNEEDEVDSGEQEKSYEPLEFMSPVPSGNYYFADAFADKSAIGKKWILSRATKDGVSDDIAKYNGEWEIGQPDKVVLKNDYGLILKTRARHHAISARLSKNFDFKPGKPLIIMYDVLFQNGQECGGAYIKLLSYDKDFELSQFHDKAPYTIMFGPDRCGLTEKLHFIIRYKNPINGTYEEKHAKQPEKSSLGDLFSDKKSHLYTLILQPDGSYQIQVDQKKIAGGTLMDSLTPPITPAKEFDDPDDKRPSDWDDREKIPDPDAKKPDDWDESAPEFIEDANAKKPNDWLEDEPDHIPDPTAVKPDDWDDEMDGTWAPKLIKNEKCEGISGCGKWKPDKIKNPAYKGKWYPPMVSNPNFKGQWKPRVIPNPYYFEEKEPFKALDTISAIGLELWSMSEGIVFDNFLITDDQSVADLWAVQSWYIKSQAERTRTRKESFFGNIIATANERPWLWAVFVLVLLIPIVLIIVFCCSGSKEDKDVAARKKTDAPTSDVPDEGEGETVEEMGDEVSQASEERGGGSSKEESSGSRSPSKSKHTPSPSKTKQAAKKADLELDASEDEEEEEEEIIKESDEGNISPKAKTRKPQGRARKE